SITVKLPAINKAPLLEALQQLVDDNTIYRIKGFAALPGKPMRLLIHAVGKRFDSYFDRHWQKDETPSTRLVLIGRDLDQTHLQKKLDAELITTGV
ncbi:MAG: GTP-binding protein, partial [Pseudomonadota bacterium]